MPETGIVVFLFIERSQFASRDPYHHALLNVLSNSRGLSVVSGEFPL
jgi:hypothetical protein